MSIISQTDYVKHCMTRNEMIRGKRFTSHELTDVHSCCYSDYFQEYLVYDEKIARDFAYIFSQIVKNFIDSAKYKE